MPVSKVERSFSRPLMTIVISGIVAGTVDIGAACLISGRTVTYILQTIAGGLLAKRAFEGGSYAAALGLALQWLMGVIIAAIYVFALRRLASLRRHWIMFGVLYGAAIFVVMNYVVVPLSAWGVVPNFSVKSFIENMAAMLLFGLLVSFLATRSGRASGAGTRV